MRVVLLIRKKDSIQDCSVKFMLRSDSNEIFKTSFQMSFATQEENQTSCCRRQSKKIIG